jgi:hypothetical protein
VHTNSKKRDAKVGK